jgi:hypothetical protein
MVHQDCCSLDRHELINLLLLELLSPDPNRFTDTSTLDASEPSEHEFM